MINALAVLDKPFGTWRTPRACGSCGRRTGGEVEYRAGMGNDLQTEHERYLTENISNGPWC